MNQQKIQRITVEKEGYSTIKTAKTENLVLSSDNTWDCNFVLNPDIRYWTNKVKSLINISPRTAKISYQIGYCYWKNGLRTKSQELLSIAYDNMLDALTKDPKCKHYATTAYKISNGLWEKTQNRKYKDDAEHFKNLAENLE